MTEDTIDSLLTVAQSEMSSRFVEQALLAEIRARLVARDFHGWLRKDRVALIAKIDACLEKQEDETK